MDDAAGSRDGRPGRWARITYFWLGVALWVGSVAYAVQRCSVS